MPRSQQWAAAVPRIGQAGRMSARWRWTGLVGIGLIGLGMVGMLASFPFIYGDPGPGQDPTDPAWFGPVATCLVIAIGLGIGLVGAVAIRWLMSPSQAGRARTAVRSPAARVGGMIELDQARQLLFAACPPVQPVLLDVPDAAGCVLAAEVTADGRGAAVRQQQRGRLRGPGRRPARHRHPAAGARHRAGRLGGRSSGRGRPDLEGDDRGAAAGRGRRGGDGGGVLGQPGRSAGQRRRPGRAASGRPRSAPGCAGPAATSGRASCCCRPAPCCDRPTWACWPASEPARCWATPGCGSACWSPATSWSPTAGSWSPARSTSPTGRC